jgi:hypothetical protein
MNASASITRDKIDIQSQPEAPACAAIDPQTRHELIAQAAYFRAQHRGFMAGHEQEDWSAAEMEVNNALIIGAKS